MTKMAAISMVRPVDIYLASSTLHFFWAFVLAAKHRGERDSHLVIIDQYTNRPMVFNHFINTESAPFVATQLMAGRELNGIAKWRNRRAQFAWTTNYVKEHRIERVFIGNDRSVLGQFIIKQAKSYRPNCLGCYLDEGVYTYLGRAASQKKSERYVDAFLKKMMYGFWYDTPLTIGASKWIDQAWVMYPNQVNQALKSKCLHEIYPDNNGFKELTGLAQKVLEEQGVSMQRLAALDVLITLPNQTIFSKVAHYEQAIATLLAGFEAQGLNVAIKYHPAAGDSDPLKLEQQNVWRLPGQVSFEMLLPFLKQCTVVGDVSSTILLANYAEGVKRVVMVQISDDNYSIKMAEFCKKIMVDVVSVNDCDRVILSGCVV
ncbi:hypothetical protein [Thiomicrorhabdus aquaedulcis]|uniref:hypothetical protein n=1 Tax=Thiomicrorhabdus aquaedulcis TaxID=2211106 RepID=UPI000FD77478|nr:hypothetical protein [Thiomicrorhabdus aquaedulcis]